MALEKYLKRQKDDGHSRGSGDMGPRNILHLIANLALTEDEIFRAALSSRKSLRDSNGKDVLFLEYRDAR